MTDAPSSQPLPAYRPGGERRHRRFGHRMRMLRTGRKLSQSELSKIAGIGVPTISNIENGRNEPRLSTLIALSDAFHVSLDELVGRDAVRATTEAVDAPNRVMPVPQRVREELERK